MLRANSKLRVHLGPDKTTFLEEASGSIARLLPHTDVMKWTEGDAGKTGATWGDSDRRHVNVCINFEGSGRAIYSEVRRKAAPSGVGAVERTVDSREYAICDEVALMIENVLSEGALGGPRALEMLANRFDEDVIAAHLQKHHKLDHQGIAIADVFGAMRTLAGQTYENKALSFGCLVDAKSSKTSDVRFPSDFLTKKRYKALTDGFRTGYVVSKNGALVGFIDVDDARRASTDSGRYPEWAGYIAGASHKGRCGICLTRAGDILVFDDGVLRFSYRFGQWRYWNHSHLIDLLRGLARVQHVAPALIKKVVTSVYRTALDVSFRRTGGMLVILRRRDDLRAIVRAGDAIGDDSRDPIDAAFDGALPGSKIQSTPRRIAAELAGIDGAVVVASSGDVLAYGAVLQPKRRGKISATEGSRSKAAIGASNYGVVMKISADGGITVFHKGTPVLEV
ncbi:MAG: hypothetical protein ACKV2T_37955 [Kofleriaceae bacterium]